jgi:KaiC/GvpD/RAD55 family RecA-like ATPase
VLPLIKGNTLLATIAREPLTLVIDSLSTLAQDLESTAETYGFLREVMKEINVRPSKSALVSQRSGLRTLVQGND